MSDDFTRTSRYSSTWTENSNTRKTSRNFWLRGGHTQRVNSFGSKDHRLSLASVGSQNNEKNSGTLPRSQEPKRTKSRFFMPFASEQRKSSVQSVNPRRITKQKRQLNNQGKFRDALKDIDITQMEVIPHSKAKAGNSPDNINLTTAWLDASTEFRDCLLDSENASEPPSRLHLSPMRKMKTSSNDGPAETEYLRVGSSNIRKLREDDSLFDLKDDTDLEDSDDEEEHRSKTSDQEIASALENIEKLFAPKKESRLLHNEEEFIPPPSMSATFARKKKQQKDFQL